MGNIEKYRNTIQEIIKKYANEKPLPKDVEGQTIFDKESDHYQLLNVGWYKDKWIFGCVLHIDIKNGKVWIQHNGTEDEIAEELIKSGIPEQDIVIGFHSPFKRKFTKFAAG
ncbi:XisH protein domain-conaining protein [Desulfonema limicola]|uniref:XisH protein domain-conaining protein n=1 Tax=Desulfonema limicola TaxID=45656 RepID=A0A975B9U0_9BACT|nr:XisI protein [Desulfonema limicola]QTA81317.1 XisH protein domain-conaining protein [Desulfonema limicola]